MEWMILMKHMLKHKAGHVVLNLVDNTLRPSGTVLAGIAFKLSKRINLLLKTGIHLLKMIC